MSETIEKIVKGKDAMKMALQLNPLIKLNPKAVGQCLLKKIAKSRSPTLFLEVLDFSTESENPLLLYFIHHIQELLNLYQKDNLKQFIGQLLLDWSEISNHYKVFYF